MNKETKRKNKVDAKDRGGRNGETQGQGVDQWAGKFHRKRREMRKHHIEGLQNESVKQIGVFKAGNNGKRAKPD